MANKSGSCNIKVGVRVRPVIAREEADPLRWKCDEKRISRIDPDSGKIIGSMDFDQVFDAASTNQNIFESMVKHLVKQAVEGLNATILAYGQTSSGKTHTMMGHKLEQGIVPLTMEYIFQAIDELQHKRRFLIGVSFLEVYNEKVRDLLCPEKMDLRIQEDILSGGVKVDCKTEMVNNASQMLKFMEQGNQAKSIGETNMNERSSRSHTIFRITVESQEDELDADGAVCVSQINLVDLAGSERASATGATGQRYKEGCAINRSLLQLGNVVQKLSEDKGEFIDYRSSKLTRILQSSLSGNANIAMICNITPVAAEQTQCTLLFAARASTIKLSPHVTEVMDDATLIKRHTKKIHLLEKQLQEAAVLKETNEFLTQEIDRLRNMVVLCGGGSINPKEERERVLRRQTWGGPEMRRGMAATLPTLPEEPYPAIRSNYGGVFDALDAATTRYSIDSDFGRCPSLDLSSLSSTEQPMFLSRASLDTCPSAGRPASVRSDETPPRVLRDRILQLQRRCEQQGTPQSVLRDRISKLEKELLNTQSHSGTSPEILQERISVLSDSHTPVSVLKERLQRQVVESASLTPPSILRTRLQEKDAALKQVVSEYDELREFTTLERQLLEAGVTEDHQELLKEVESLRLSNSSYEQMCLDRNKTISELATENHQLVERLEDLENKNEILHRELETNKSWNSKNNEQHLFWKRELEEYKQKLSNLTNESKDWLDEKELLISRHNAKVAELQDCLKEAWAEQKRLSTVVPPGAPDSVDKGVQITNEDEEQEKCDLLREKMFFMEQELENLKTDIAFKQENLKGAHSEVDRLQRELVTTKKSNTIMDLECREKIKELEDLRSQLDELRKAKVSVSYADVSIQNVELESNQELLEELGAAKTEAAKLEAQNLSLLQDREKILVFVQNLHDTLSIQAEKEGSESLQKIFERLEELIRERDELKSTLESVSAQEPQEETSEAIRELNVRLEELTKERDELKSTLESFSSQVPQEEALEAIQELAARLEELIKERDELKSTLDSVSAQEPQEESSETIRELNVRVEDLTKERDELKSTLDSASAQEPQEESSETIRELNVCLEKLTKERDEFKSTLDSVSAQEPQEESSETIRELTARLEELIKERDELKSMLDSVSVQEPQEESSETIRELNVRLEELTKERDELKSMLASRSEEETNEAIQELTKRLEVLTIERDGLNSTLENVITQGSQDETIAALNDRLEELTKERDGLKSALTDRDSQEEEVIKRLEDVSSERDELRLTLEELRGMKKDQVFEYQHDSLTVLGTSLQADEEKELLRQEISRLQDQLVKLEADVSSKLEISGDQKNVQDLEEECKRLEDTNSALTEKLKAMLELVKSRGKLAHLPLHLSGDSPDVYEFLSHQITELLISHETSENNMALLEQELAELKDKHSSLTSELDEARNKVKDLYSAETSLKSQVTQLQEKWDSLSNNTAEVSTCKERFVSEIRSLNPSQDRDVLLEHELSRLQEIFFACVVEKQSEIAKWFQEELSQVKHKNSNLKSDLTEREHQITDLEHCLCESRAQLLTKQQDIEDLQQKIKDLSCLEKALSEARGEVLTLQEQVSEAQRELQCQEAAKLELIQHLQDELQSANAKKQDLEILLDAAQNELKSHHSDSQAARYPEKIQHLEEINQSLEEEAKQLGLKLQEVEACLDEANTYIANKEGEMDSLKTDYERKMSELIVNECEMQDHIKSLQEAAEDSKRHVLGVEHELKDVKEKYNSALRHQEEMENKYGKLQDELQDSVVTIQRLEAELEDQNKQIEAVKQDATQMESQKNLLAHLQEKYEEQISRLNEIIVELKQMSEEKDEAMKNLSDQVEELQALESQLQGQLFGAQKQHQDAMATLTALEQEHASCETNLREERTKQVTEVEKATADLRDNFLQAKQSWTTERNSLLEEKEMLTNQLTVLAKDFDDKVELLETLNSKCSQLETEHANWKEIRQQLMVTQEQAQKAEAELSDASFRLSQLQNECDALKDEMQELRNSASDSEKTLSELRTALCNAENKNLVAEKSLENKQEEISELTDEISKERIVCRDLRAAQTELKGNFEEVCTERDLILAKANKLELQLETISNDQKEQNILLQVYKSDFTKSKALLNEVQGEKEGLVERLHGATKEIEELKKKAEEAEEEFQEMLKDYKENYEQRVKFETEALERAQTGEALEKRVSELESELQELQNKTLDSGSIADLQAKASRVVELERLLEDSNRTCAQYEAEVMQQRREKVDLRGEIAQLKRKIIMDDLPHKNEMVMFKKRAEFLEAKIQTLQSELRHARSVQMNNTFQECHKCHRAQRGVPQATQTNWQEGVRSVQVQAPPDNEALWDRRDGYMPWSAVVEATRMYGMRDQIKDLETKVTELQKERVRFKDELRKRNAAIRELQQQLANKENSSGSAPPVSSHKI